ncbi:hypothetical protein [Shimia thalassica]|uniref:hypothetical protein n=1 Tax=Shimia thalassica TaxID=1715693 RepID=UPI0026E3E76A|nr:hypothetical protein [Shimia thalassica]MDO6799367.1 hypothetical protein [Shimia thalassica]
MIVKVLETRHTKVGTLRRGVIFKPDMESDAVAKVINDLLKAKPAPIKKLTKAQAEKEKAGVTSLAEADVKGATPTPIEALKAAELALSEKDADLLSVKSELENADKALAEKDAKIEALEKQLADKGAAK